MSDQEPFLHVAPAGGATRAVALVLHGGRSTSTAPVRSGQLAVLRMAPFVSSLRSAGSTLGLTVARLRYLVRGWNGASRSPVADVCWALDRLAERFPGAPVALVGHSMGGRAALYAAGHEAVHSVVGLAPWLEAGDPVEQVRGRRLLVLHGDNDRMTGPAASAAYTTRAARVAASAAYVSVRGDGHAMLRRARLWHQLATGFVLATTCAAAPAGTVDPSTANVLAQALAGQQPLVV